MLALIVQLPGRRLLVEKILLLLAHQFLITTPFALGPSGHQCSRSGAAGVRGCELRLVV